MDTMTDIMALSWAGKIAAAILAAVFIWGLARLWDRSAGWTFAGLSGALRTDPRALALYLGLRLVALALVFGLVLAFA